MISPSIPLRNCLGSRSCRPLALPSAVPVAARQPLRIAIIGCGTAGPAAACLLARQGHHVDIFERASPLRPVGAGLLVQPTGMHVLHRLDLLDRACSLGHRINHLIGENTSGRRILDLSYTDFAPQTFGLGMHRGALFSLLLDAAQHEPLVRIHAGVDISHIHQAHTHVTLRTHANQLLGPYDLTIIADGARSHLRTQVQVNAQTTRYAYAAAWCVLPMPTHARWQSTLRQTYRDTRSMIGYLPSGKPAPDAEPTISVFWSLRADKIESLRTAGLAEFERRVIELDPHAAPLLIHLRSMDQLVFATYYDTICDRIHHHRVALLGDAAHAMSPQLGQGANLALVDALNLVDTIALHAPTTEAIPAALTRHDADRRDHVAFYTRASRWLTPWFQSDLAPLALPRDLLMHPLSRIPWIKQQMAQSLAGVKTGIFSSYRFDH